MASTPDFGSSKSLRNKPALKFLPSHDMTWMNISTQLEVQPDLTFLTFSTPMLPLDRVEQNLLVISP
jgi:hypothetical protein